MYLHKQVCAIITLRRMFEIVYVQNFISSPVIKQMIHLTFFQNPLVFFIKCNFYRQNLYDPPLAGNCRASKIYFHDDVILTSALRSYICLKLTVVDFRSDKYTFDCKYISFCIYLNTFIRLGIANSFLFIIFSCCYFYVIP